jgi:hypothetical protein
MKLANQTASQRSGPNLHVKTANTKSLGNQGKAKSSESTEALY